MDQDPRRLLDAYQPSVQAMRSISAAFDEFRLAALRASTALRAFGVAYRRALTTKPVPFKPSARRRYGR